MAKPAAWSKKLAVYALPLSSALFAAPAAAVDLDFSGFASFVYATPLNKDEKTVFTEIDENQQKVFSEVSGYNHGQISENEYNEFNKFGLRLTADLGKGFKAGAQLIANGEDDYEPEFDWLYAQYNFTPNVSIKVGRMTTPLFLYSDVLDTTYAYQWIEAPYSLYGSGNVKTLQGLMLDWREEMGNGWTSLLTVFTGEIDELIPQLGANVFIDGGVGLSWEVEYEWLRLRAVHYQGRSSVDALNDSLGASLDKLIFATSDQLNSDFGTPLANGTVSFTNNDEFERIDWEDERASYTGFGLAIDLEYYFANLEAAQVDIDGTAAVGLLDSWYLMQGVRLPNDWSLSFTFSEDRDGEPDYDYDRLTDVLAEAYVDTALSAPQQGAQKAYLGAIVSANLEQTLVSARKEESQTYILGTRWDFHPQASMKMEYLERFTTTYDYNLNKVKRRPTAFRVGLDLVF